MKHKNIISCISIILALLFCFNCAVFSASSVSVVDEKISENKISPNLQSTLDQLDAYDKVKVAVWLYDIDNEVKNMAFTNKLKKETDNGNISNKLYSKSALLQNDSISDSQQLSLNEAQTLLSIKRSSYKELHRERNVQWRNSIKQVLKTPKVIFTSSYAPVVILEITKSDANKVALSDEVAYIYPWEELEEPIDDDIQYEQSATSSESVDYGVWKSITNINVMQNAWGYYGNGIKIGMLENALPEINHSSGMFNKSSIIPVNNATTDSHATYVASILVGRTDDYVGAAPYADLFCASHNGTYFGSIETLINNGINILSISLALGARSGTYNTYGNYSKYLDYIVYNYDVTVCKSSGNYSANPGVPEGAMGYNSITVGNLDDKNTTTNEDDIIDGLSSYVTSSTEAYKPDICAPGDRVGTPVNSNLVETGKGGTSYATPIVAGICAILMEADPVLTTRPMLLKSILLSGAKRIPNMDSAISTATTTAPALSRSYGAGLVSAINSYNILKNENWRYIPLVTPEQSENPYTMNIKVSQNHIKASKKLAVCLAWTQKVMSTPLNSSTASSTVYNVYHHDLGVYDPNGNLVAYSNYNYDRKQFVYFQPTFAGTYQIKVYKTGTAQSGVLTAMAYYLS